MEEKVFNTIQKYRLISSGDHVIVGLSGGADSVCLLWILNHLKERLSIGLSALHLHHGLRGEEANEDANFSKDLCAALGIECKVFYRDIRKEAVRLKLSQEEAGRKVRYELFAQESSKKIRGKIAIAHHMNDQAETALFNLIRGSGLRGLGGIRPKRDNIIRPLLECTRQEIEAYCEKNTLAYQIDKTNHEDQYSRNKLRNHVIPYIEENFNPTFIKQMGMMCKNLQEENAFLDRLSQEKYYDVVALEGAHKIAFDIHKLLTLDVVLRKRIYRQGILRFGFGMKDYEEKHYHLIEELVLKESGKIIHLPQGILAVKSYNMLYFQRDLVKPHDWEYKIEKETQQIQVDEAFGAFLFRSFPLEKDMKFPQNKYTKWFDCDKIVGNLTLRNRKPGDFIYLNERNDKKKLKDFFIDEKIPREERMNIPLLSLGMDILWIVGYRMSSYYKVSDKTKNILEVHYRKENS